MKTWYKIFDMPILLAYNEAIHKKAYEALNREWIEREFRIEPHDLAIFESPQKYIIDRGGFIFMAIHNDKIVGTCSAIKIDDNTFELAKLAVTADAQGLGLGRALCEKVICEARHRGARVVQITTNTKLETAMKLYEKLGFKLSSESFHDNYERCNASLILELGNARADNLCHG